MVASLAIVSTFIIEKFLFDVMNKICVDHRMDVLLILLTCNKGFSVISALFLGQTGFLMANLAVTVYVAKTEFYICSVSLEDTENTRKLMLLGYSEGFQITWT